MLSIAIVWTTLAQTSVDHSGSDSSVDHSGSDSPSAHENVSHHSVRGEAPVNDRMDRLDSTHKNNLHDQSKGLAIDTSQMCFHEGRHYKPGQEFFEGCTSICICTESLEVHCAAIECPLSFGLELIDPDCLDWQIDLDHIPEPPKCCGQMKCVSTSACHYMGNTYKNYDQIPREITGCSQVCTCNYGNVTCRDLCDPVPTIPPFDLKCALEHAVIVTLPGETCCRAWRCATHSVEIIFAESLEVLVMALEALHEEAKPLGLEVSWLKTKVQVFGGLLDEAVQSVHACGEDIEILESFTYLGSAVHNDRGSRQEVLRRIGIAHGVMDSLSGSIWRCRYLCRRTKIRIFKSLVIPVLLYGCVPVIFPLPSVSVVAAPPTPALLPATYPATYPATPALLPATYPATPALLPATYPATPALLPATYPATPALLPATYPATPFFGSDEQIREPHIASLDARTSHLIFSTPSLHQGLPGELFLRYTNDPVGQADPNTWMEEVLVPMGSLISQSEWDHILTGLQPATHYTLQLHRPGHRAHLLTRVHLRHHGGRVSFKFWKSVFCRITSKATTPPTTTPLPRLDIDAELYASEVTKTSAKVSWRSFSDYELQYIDGVQVKYTERTI
ncbi:putative epidermal cell surface receptor [Chionoecetes opilio]|uniref:Putative epidermal cell surface receptor n=1 Tax=Chionoecetes opilio TaxID=41210 RepID=A0A8J4XR12_CHIOP|nr:putative epidermal cell surface receptor [Chionoecetes opilio]